MRKFKLYMKRFLLLCTVLGVSLYIQAQPNFGDDGDTSWKKVYRGSYPKTNDLVHTKLDVKFDYAKSYLYGKEWLTLQPHFYPTDSVLLDAKGMDIKEISIIKGTAKTALKYTYDGLQVNIKLDRLYTAQEKYTLYFDYISKPNEVKVAGSMAISDAKGLYFINPLGDDKKKPIQIWTQGETESNSVWMFTIDKPNQKTTEEITMTVPAKYVTLSNGLKISEKKNADGTRTDYWKMDLPHSPYLFFMGVGEFDVTKDSYKGKEVSYYTEKNQTKYARQVFGNTPEMIKFFSEKLGVDYPWAKYSQIVGRDYVSGAMENTTATLHGEGAYQNSRQLADGNGWEETIAHELFHQWFGDYVTAESWSNITVNESFANYSEYLWNEYKYGKDAADEHNYRDMMGYIGSHSEDKDLVRYYYEDKEDVFDAVSYNKGGRILHMLRNYVGDDAFFKSLNNYLTTNKFKNGEAAQLRLAFEETTGKDLQWFWNQWYYGAGHPKLTISYNYNIAGMPGVAEVVVQQTQNGQLFTLPIAVDVYEAGKKERYDVTLSNKSDTFYFKVNGTPDFINVDADKVLLAEKTDNKTEANYIAQWNNAKNYLDRREALEFFAKKNMPEIAKGLYDKYAPLRNFTLQRIVNTPYKSDKVVLEQIEKMAKTETNTLTKAAAINYLIKIGDAKYLPIYQAAINDSSYSVAGAALKGIAALDADGAYTIAKKHLADAKGSLNTEAKNALYAKGNEGDFELLASDYSEGPASFAKVSSTGKFAEYLAKLNDTQKIKTGVDFIIAFRNSIPAERRSRIDPSIKSALEKISKAKGGEIEQYIQANFK